MATLITIMVVMPITATTTIRIVFHDHGSHHDNHDSHNDPIGGLSDTTRNSDTDGSNDKKDTTLDPSFPQQHIDHHKLQAPNFQHRLFFNALQGVQGAWEHPR